MNSYFKISCKDIENCNQINDYIKNKLKEGNTMTRNQWILDKDTDYKTKWHRLLKKIDGLSLDTATKFQLAIDIDRLIDKAMTLSSSQTEIDRTAWRD